MSTDFDDQNFLSLEEIPDLNDQYSVTEINTNFSQEVITYFNDQTCLAPVVSTAFDGQGQP